MAARPAVHAIRPLSKAEALSQFQAHPELAANVSAAARQWGCSRATARQRLEEWTAATGGATGTATSVPTDTPAAAIATMALPVAVPWRSGPITFAAVAAAMGLAATAAVFSVQGMIVLFPGAPVAIIAMAVAMEAGKLATAAWVAHQWHVTGSMARAVLITLVTGLAAINAAGVYSQLVAAHVGDRVAATSSVESELASVTARIEVQSHTVLDLDQRLGQIDAAISEMTRRGNTARALEAIGAQRKGREALASERRREADTLAGLKAQLAATGAKGSAIEVEATPIRYVAALFGGTAEQAIRLLILLMVLTCDPLAIALTASAAAARRQ